MKTAVYARKIINHKRLTIDKFIKFIMQILFYKTSIKKIKQSTGLTSSRKRVTNPISKRYIYSSLLGGL